MDTPDIKFAKSDDISIAYQQFGSGPDVVAVAPFAQNVEVLWEDRHSQRLFERLSSFCRFTHFDKRGTGLSDRTVGAPSLEQRMDDFRAVMDACGIERASIAGVSEGGPMALLFAATYPARVDKLMLFGTFATAPWNIDPGLEFQRPLVEAWIDVMAEHWGTPSSIVVPSFAPSMAGDAEYCRWMQRYERASLTPKSVREMMGLNLAIDVRDVLPLVQAPTLVTHRLGDQIAPVAGARYLVEHLPNATLIELPGDDHLPWIGDQEAWIGPFEEFLLGQRGTVPVDTERVLAAVLFTDIVGSTDKAGALGDRAWRDLLDAHDQAMRAEIARFGGREVKTTGDGFLATFESPGRAVRAASAMTAAGARIGCPIRAGVHAGEVELRGNDVAGMAVHIGARVGSLAAAGEVLVTSTVRDLVIGSELRFSDRGTHELKGVQGDWRLLALCA